jgi:hypothetical protein
VDKAMLNDWKTKRKARNDNAFIFYTFPILAKQMPKEAIIIVEYRHSRWEVPIIYETSWNIRTH